MKAKPFWMILILLLTGILLFASFSITRRVSAKGSLSAPGKVTASGSVYAPTPVPTSQPVNGVTANDVNRVAKKLYCPVCPNTPLDVCETQACKDWRAQIREQLSSGWSDQQVMDYFVKQYGERVLAEPERGGFTSLVWTLPVLVVSLGIILVGLVLKSWRTSQKAKLASVQQKTQITPAISREVLDKIEAEIRQID
jgi:cytochrome c-type biogenesis protein CcmH